VRRTVDLINFRSVTSNNPSFFSFCFWYLFFFKKKYKFDFLVIYIINKYIYFLKKN
jgi:hypothetical protein